MQATVIVTQQRVVVVRQIQRAATIVGVQGPAGIVPAFVHTQNTPALTWVINHHLDFQPNVEIRDTGGIELLAQVIHASLHQTIVYFNSPTAGTARCN
jgi:hypothetical protein